MGGLRGHRPLCPPDRNGRGEQGSANSEVLCTHCAPRARWLSRGQGVGSGSWLGRVGQGLPCPAAFLWCGAWWPILMVKEEIWGPGVCPRPWLPAVCRPPWA